MEKKRLVLIIGFVFVLVLTFFLAKQNISNASECRVVRIIAFANYQDVTLDPKTVYVNKDDCVIWFNNASNSEVQIIFEDKKVCTDVVDASMDFKLDEKNCFITKTYIRPLGTASLAFTKEGSYGYIVQVKGTALKIQGEIKVK